MSLYLWKHIPSSKSGNLLTLINNFASKKIMMAIIKCWLEKLFTEKGQNRVITNLWQHSIIINIKFDSIPELPGDLTSRRHGNTNHVNARIEIMTGVVILSYLNTNVQTYEKSWIPGNPPMLAAGRGLMQLMHDMTSVQWSGYINITLRMMIVGENWNSRGRSAPAHHQPIRGQYQGHVITLDPLSSSRLVFFSGVWRWLGQ